MSLSHNWIFAVWMGALLGSGGCGPISEDERVAEERQKNEKEQREALRQALNGGTEESVAIKIVQTAAAPQGGGTVEQWLQTQAATNGSSIVFPRWETERRGMGKYDVIFTCALMQEDGNVDKWGLIWSVDILLKTATGPREMDPNELNARSARYFRDRRRGLSTEPLNMD